MIRSIHRRFQLAIGARRRSGQGGYALMFVMGVIALTSVVIVALLGLALTSARIAQEQAALAKETRAADGALEAAVSDVSRTSGDPCTALDLPPGAVRTVDFLDGTGGPMPVTVACSPNARPESSEAFVGTPRVEIVGTGPYSGGLPAPTAPPVLTADPTLVYTGSAPLRFASDVLVERGAAVASSAAGGPAVELTGQYVQRQQIGGGCGPLGVDGPNRIVDNSGAPACDPGMEALSATVPSSLAAGPALGGAVACPGAGGVLALEPGPYTVARSNSLNRVLSNCPGATVWFKPGVHAIDVNDPVNPSADRNALVISDPQVRVVFGEPRGWSPAGAQPANFPQACDPSQSGATLQLSGRTALRHRAGRVAMCPAFQAGTRLPAIVQVGTFTNRPEWVGSNSEWFLPFDRLRPGSTAWATARLTCEFCIGIKSAAFDTRWANLPSGPLRSAQLLMETQQVPVTAGIPDTAAAVHSMTIVARIDVFQGSTLVCRTATAPSGRSFDGTIAYDLRTGECQAALAEGSALEGATLRASFARADNGDPRPLEIRVRNVRLEVNASTATATGATAGASWTSVANARVADNAAATATQDPAFGNPSASWSTPGTTHALTVTGLAFPPGELEPDAPLDALQVALRSETSALNVLSDPADGARVRFEVLEAGGAAMCSVSADTHAMSNRMLRYDMLAGDCATKITTASQLQGKSLRVTFATGCTDAIWPFTRPYLEPGGTGRCVSVVLPRLDVVAVTATTGAVTARPPFSEVTVAKDSAAAGGSSFDVYGDTVLPRSDLNIRWRGEHYTRPLFGGGLKVHGLGSDTGAGAKVGYVCCSPVVGAGEVQASVDGTVRARAAVKVAGDGSVALPRPVEILDWKLCGRGGSCGAG